MLQIPKLLDFTYRKIEGLPRGSVILAGGLAMQCSAIQDQKKIWVAVGFTTGLTTGIILSAVRQEKMDFEILYVAS